MNTLEHILFRLGQKASERGAPDLSRDLLALAVEVHQLDIGDPSTALMRAMSLRLGREGDTHDRHT